MKFTMTLSIPTSIILTRKRPTNRRGVWERSLLKLSNKNKANIVAEDKDQGSCLKPPSKLLATVWITKTIMASRGLCTWGLTERVLHIMEPTPLLEGDDYSANQLPLIL